MNELHWIQDQVPFEARGAAREAARHEGKTLGEWLNDVIADYAADLGQPTDFLTEDERAEAVALRLEDLRNRVVSFEPRQRPAQRSWTVRRDDVDSERRMAGRGGRQSDRHSRHISESVAQNRLLDRAVDMLAADPRDRRLVRHHVSPSFATSETGGVGTKADGSYRQLDQKLDTILQAVQTWPAIDQDDLEARDASPTSDGRLGQAIADVVRRQKTLNLSEIKPVAPRVPLRRRGVHEEAAPAYSDAPTSHFAPAPATQTPVASNERMEAGSELAVLCSEIAETLREHHDRRGSTMRAPAPAPPRTTSDKPARSPTVAAQNSGSARATPRPTEVEKTSARSTPVSPQANAIRAVDQVPEQTSRPEATAFSPPPNPPVDSAAMAAISNLQRQVADLSQRFEATDTYRVQLQTIDQRLLRLAEEQAITASRCEATAAEAARHAVESVMTTGRFAKIDTVARDVTSFRDRQTAAENRTMLALDSVRETLNQVAERLVSVESGVASALAVATPKAASPLAPRAEPRMPPVAAAPVPPPLSAEPAAAPARRSAPGDKKIDQVNIERELINQARRSAAAARKPALDMRRPLAQFPNGLPQTSIAKAARSYLSRRRMPIGIGLAATGVIAAALTAGSNLSALSPHDSFATASASFAPAPPQPQTVRDTQTRAPSPVAAPASGMNSMAFSVDPLQTASFTKMTHGPSATPSAPLPPVPDSGAAAYAQGDAYAVGRGVPRDFARAAEAFERAAHLGIVPAQVRLASLYEKGLGVERDREKAKTLYTKAAEAGNPNAMHNLAVLLTDGAGHPDYDGAATWFRRAAQLGLRDSQFNLGVFYAEGLGVNRSYIESYQWFAIAADQGDDGAAKKRDIVATKLSPSDLMVAKAIASSFHPRRIEPTAVVVPQGGQNASSPVALNRV